jgi:hypothetical protein
VRAKGATFGATWRKQRQDIIAAAAANLTRIFYDSSLQLPPTIAGDNDQDLLITADHILLLGVGQPQKPSTATATTCCFCCVGWPWGPTGDAAVAMAGE